MWMATEDLPSRGPQRLVMTAVSPLCVMVFSGLSVINLRFLIHAIYFLKKC